MFNISRSKCSRCSVCLRGIKEPAMPFTRGKKPALPAGSKIPKLNATTSENQVKDALHVRLNNQLGCRGEAVNKADIAAAVPWSCLLPRGQRLKGLTYLNVKLMRLVVKCKQRILFLQSVHTCDKCVLLLCCRTKAHRWRGPPPLLMEPRRRGLLLSTSLMWVLSYRFVVLVEWTASKF